MTQFVTFRLADSFPAAQHREWEYLLRIEGDSKRREELETYLDAGRGSCHLRRPEIGAIVEEALLFFHRERYELRAWVVMPNHVHVMFKETNTPMAQILASWKKHSAQRANRLLRRRGEFWQADYWDTFMRSSEQETEARRYIENNPAKACLVLDPKAWPLSSARFRNDQGVLVL